MKPLTYKDGSQDKTKTSLLNLKVSKILWKKIGSPYLTLTLRCINENVVDDSEYLCLQDPKIQAKCPKKLHVRACKWKSKA